MLFEGSLGLFVVLPELPLLLACATVALLRSLVHIHELLVLSQVRVVLVARHRLNCAFVGQHLHDGCAELSREGRRVLNKSILDRLQSGHRILIIFLRIDDYLNDGGAFKDLDNL